MRITGTTKAHSGKRKGRIITVFVAVATTAIMTGSPPASAHCDGINDGDGDGIGCVTTTVAPTTTIQVTTTAGTVLVTSAPVPTLLATQIAVPTVIADPFTIPPRALPVLHVQATPLALLTTVTTLPATGGDHGNEIALALGFISCGIALVRINRKRVAT